MKAHRRCLLHHHRCHYPFPVSPSAPLYYAPTRHTTRGSFPFTARIATNQPTDKPTNKTGLLITNKHPSLPVIHCALLHAYFNSSPGSPSIWLVLSFLVNRHLHPTTPTSTSCRPRTAALWAVAAKALACPPHPTPGSSRLSSFSSPSASSRLLSSSSVAAVSAGLDCNARGPVAISKRIVKELEVSAHRETAAGRGPPAPTKVWTSSARPLLPTSRKLSPVRPSPGMAASRWPTSSTCPRRLSSARQELAGAPYPQTTARPPVLRLQHHPPSRHRPLRSREAKGRSSSWEGTEPSPNCTNSQIISRRYTEVSKKGRSESGKAQDTMFEIFFPRALAREGYCER